MLTKDEQIKSLGDAVEAYSLETRNLRTERDTLSAELERVKAERDELNRIINEVWETFYGQGMEVANWHLNGNLEPIDNFFEQNEWDPESCRAAAEQKGTNNAN